MSRRRILKIGGSVLASLADTAAIGAALAPYRDELILVHGAGRAPRQALPEGHRGRRFEASATQVVAAVRAALGQVHDSVIESLVTAGLAPTAVPLSSWMGLRGGEVTFDASVLRDVASAESLPLLYGGVLEDSEGGFEIVSSDRVVEVLAPAVAASQVVWATEAPGVVGVDGQVLASVSRAGLAEVERRASDQADATGGMAAKLVSAFAVADAGIDSQVVDGRSFSAVASVLAGESIGTRVTS